MADKAILGGSLENDENIQKKQKTLAKLVITYTPQKILLRVREGVKKIDFFQEKVLNYGWVGVKSPKLVKM